MYSPASFRREDPDELRAFIERHNFATLVTAAAGLSANHLPLLIESDAAGAICRLVGHVAKANDHWRVAEGAQTLAIFHGPHGYVSPGWQPDRDVVPTWNYVAVHAVGRWRTIVDRSRSLEIVTALVDRHERDRASPWRLDSISPEFFERMLGGIVCFEVAVDRLEGKWKLGQNHPRERRMAWIAGMEAEGDAETAHWMRDELMREESA